MPNAKYNSEKNRLDARVKNSFNNNKKTKRKWDSEQKFPTIWAAQTGHRSNPHSFSSDDALKFQLLSAEGPESARNVSLIRSDVSWASLCSHLTEYLLNFNYMY